jgi:RNA polymerase sigma-70 factor (ECF subfamily)
MGQPLEPLEPSLRDPAPDPEDAVARERAVAAAITQFVELAPVPRSCVILKDVLDQSLDEIAELLTLTVPAVKAALHRGRARLSELRAAPSALPATPSREVVRFTQLFNARDWDAVRAILADEVRLDLVSRLQRHGRRDTGSYFSNYDQRDDWHFMPGWLDGREIVAVSRRPGQPPAYIIELVWRAGELLEIHDFRYVPYLVREAAIALADAPERADS